MQDRVDAEFIQTEEFEDLTEDIFSKAAECRQQEKLDAFRSIFLNTILSDRPSYNVAAEIADLVNRWQPRHVIMLHLLADAVAVDREMGGAVVGGGPGTCDSETLARLLPDWDEDQINRTWRDLYDGRIHDRPDSPNKSSGHSSEIGSQVLENYATGFGQKVAKYVSDPT